MAGGGGFGRGLLAGARTAVLALAVLYAGLCWVLWAYEPVFVFRRLPRPPLAPLSAGLPGFAEVTVPTEDGARLYGWWRPPPAGTGAVVFLTGTGASLTDYAGLLGDLAANRFGVLGIDYRGNGASPGMPSEAAWRADARAAFDFARAAAPTAKIAAFGQSMGTGFAVMLAVDRPVAGVLLDSAYASVARLYEHGGFRLAPGVPLPARWLMRDPIDSEAAIARVHVPVLILHGTEDRVNPLAEARRLYAAANPPKQLIEVAGAGHAGVWSGAARERALTALAKWTAP